MKKSSARESKKRIASVWKLKLQERLRKRDFALNALDARKKNARDWRKSA